VVGFIYYLETLQQGKHMKKNTSRILRYLPAAFWAMAVIRLFFNAVLPLMDQTEARYGNIARIMAETKEWVVLQVDYGIPFWAKPPLSTWVAAASISLFGTSEFAARLPYFLVCIAMAFWANRYRRKNEAHFYLIPFLVLSIPEFYLHAGVVSTDVFLSVSVALVLFGFWEALNGTRPKLWGYLFFGGLGLGMLAKGPIIGILTLPPIFVWALLTKNLKRAFVTAPWVLGVLLFVGLCLPWYLMAEIRSPGFLDYFIVGEHFNRFFNSAWQGDRYGFPKQQPLGIIWVFLAGFTLPWSVLLFSKFKSLRIAVTQNPWVLYLVLWLLWTPLFFTVSKSLIHPYILPVMLPFALLVYEFWPQVKRQSVYLGIAGGLPLLLFVVYLSGAVDQVFRDSTDKFLIDTKAAVYSIDDTSYSSRYYTQGKIQKITVEQAVVRAAQNPQARILIRHKTFAKLPDSLQQQFELVTRNRKKGSYRSPR